MLISNVIDCDYDDNDDDDNDTHNDNHDDNDDDDNENGRVMSTEQNTTWKSGLHWGCAPDLSGVRTGEGSEASEECELCSSTVSGCTQLISCLVAQYHL